MIAKLGQLVTYIQACAQEHNATPETPVYVRDGANGPMRAIGKVKMVQDARGRYIILETEGGIIQ